MPRFSYDSTPASRATPTPRPGERTVHGRIHLGTVGGTLAEDTRQWQPHPDGGSRLVEARSHADDAP